MRLSLVCVALLLSVACDRPVITPLPDASTDAAQPRDAGSTDAGLDAGTDAAVPVPTGPVLYPFEQRHSPISADLGARLREIAASDTTRADDVFIKVGDSITVSGSFLHCFAGTSVDLDGRTELQSTLDTFRGGDAGGTTPFDRTSLAAGVGWSANMPLSGAPSPLDQEHAAVSPRLAVIMYGTNDVGFRAAQTFARDVWTIADLMIERGTIPLLSTIPPRDDSATANAGVALYNLAIRAIAQGRGVPFVDYHRELLPLPAHGLAADGVHPQAFSGGSCDLTSAGLQFAANVRNLITLEQLDRAVGALGGTVHDAVVPRLEGSGAPDDPFLVSRLPFVAMGDTASSPHRAINTYACSTVSEAGPELVYRVEVVAPGMLTAAVLSANGVDTDVHVLSGSVSADACVARDDTVVSTPVTPGTWYVVADTFVSAAGTELPGEYLVVITLD